MIASKPILEKLSAKDRKTFDAHFAEYQHHTEVAMKAQSERGAHIEHNFRRRHKLEKSALDPSDRKAAVELAERHAREVSEAPHKRDTLSRVARTHRAEAEEASSKALAMLIEPTEALLAEYQKRDKADRERLGVSAPGTTEEIKKTLHALRKTTGQTAGVATRLIENANYVDLSWISTSSRTVEKASDLME